MLQQLAPTNLVYAVSATWSFIQKFHREGTDRGAIFTFGDRFRVEADFTTSLPRLAAALAGIAKGGATGRATRLYDSIQDGIEAFWRAGRRDRRWGLGILTDGGDNGSTNYPHDNPNSPELIGRYIGTRFNHEPSNYGFLVGVGDDRQINARALATIGHYGNIPAVRIEGFGLLGDFFDRMAYEMSGIVVDRQGVRVHVDRRPLDYAILLDVSASMNQVAAKG
jgi:hypothetical protein